MSRPDLVIVGAGATGVSAALWARTLELSCLLIEREERIGGQLRHVHFHPPDVVGCERGDGPAIADTCARQLAERGLESRRATVAALAPAFDARGPTVTIDSGEAIEAAAVLVASGCRRRRLGVPGEEAFAGRGLSTSATRDRAALAGRSVVVVGGGDAAYENALLLARDGGEVTLLVRDTPTARVEFRMRVAASPGIRVRQGARVVALAGDERLRRVELEDASGRAFLETDAVVVKVGVEPDTGWCRTSGICDPDGWVQVNAELATNAPGVWAGGDVTRPLRASVAVAVGHGALAVAAIRRALRGD